jgi:hypothetical protein
MYSAMGHRLAAVLVASENMASDATVKHFANVVTKLVRLKNIVRDSTRQDAMTRHIFSRFFFLSSSGRSIGVSFFLSSSLIFRY